MGVFSETEDGEVRFHGASELAPEHWQDLQHTVQRRVLRHFRRHGLLDEHATSDMLSWQGTGGFSIDASVRIEAQDRPGVERLVRYCARPPFALERLHAMGGNASLASPEARLMYRLPGPDANGRTALILTPLELLHRLSRLVPPPHIHRHRYHGVLAPNARLRPRVIAIGPAEADEPREPTAATPGAQARTPNRPRTPAPDTPRRSPGRIRWAQLLARIYEVLPLLCPSCGGEMRILAVLTEPVTVRTILVHLELPHRPPPLTPARGPPQHDLLLDQTPSFDVTDPDPVPEIDLDQSLPEEFDDRDGSSGRAARRPLGPYQSSAAKYRRDHSAHPSIPTTSSIISNSSTSPLARDPEPPAQDDPPGPILDPREAPSYLADRRRGRLDFLSSCGRVEVASGHTHLLGKLVGGLEDVVGDGDRCLHTLISFDSSISQTLWHRRTPAMVGITAR